MIEAIKKFANGYRAVGIQATMGMEGHGFIATIMKDGRVIGQAKDYGDGGSTHLDFPLREDVDALLSYARSLFPDYQYATDDMFFGALIDYELAIKKLRTAAKKKLMQADETKVDQHGVAESYVSWNMTDTPENRARILAQQPNTVFLNDELNDWEELKAPRKPRR
ncbi:TPA: hypothetical protein ACK3Q6_002695 [Burkholderia cepacia]|uniref:Uncharacterized protein n=1 Tax=Burkholderia cenocepacia TaxID=95486 RepID=A0ABD4UC84_9BURK|nr:MULTISPECIES: hypothetical protein [Burkholderia cepacia complex]HDR9764212.1 hypothetical protein [Burkholderia cepacia ATCC 25416]MCA8361196.1 hypothetical protein [Burkholderia cepacia]MCW3498644.1 hypothetical protein [Burkholderia cenocepacia]MCW3506268.1 hypothetical protein [Burkholderia cenocepacia]MCW3513797.1 hypothetical protein [Burkholderia cenocepacia]